MTRLLLVAAALVLLLLPQSRAEAQTFVDGDTLYSPIVGSYRQLGASVAVDGDIAVVSDPGRVDPLCATSCGAVHIFRRTTAWMSEATYSGTGDDDFGQSVDVGGRTLVIGAPGDHAGVKVVSSTPTVWVMVVSAMARSMDS